MGSFFSSILNPKSAEQKYTLVEEIRLTFKYNGDEKIMPTVTWDQLEIICWSMGPTFYVNHTFSIKEDNLLQMNVTIVPQTVDSYYNWKNKSLWLEINERMHHKWILTNVTSLLD